MTEELAVAKEVSTQDLVANFERGLEGMLEFFENYSGQNAQRSDSKLYKVYQACRYMYLAKGKCRVHTEGTSSKADLTFKQSFNYGGFVSQDTITVDATYMDKEDYYNDLLAIAPIHGLEIRAATQSLAKNSVNMARDILGRHVQYNKLMEYRTGVASNYFTFMAFLDLADPEYTHSRASYLSLLSKGVNVVLVPYRQIDSSVYIDTTSVYVPRLVSLVTYIESL